MWRDGNDDPSVKSPSIDCVEPEREGLCKNEKKPMCIRSTEKITLPDQAKLLSKGLKSMCEKSQTDGTKSGCARDRIGRESPTQIRSRTDVTEAACVKLWIKGDNAKFERSRTGGMRPSCVFPKAETLNSERQRLWREREEPSFKESIMDVNKSNCPGLCNSSIRPESVKSDTNRSDSSRFCPKAECVEPHQM